METINSIQRWLHLFLKQNRFFCSPNPNPHPSEPSRTQSLIMIFSPRPPSFPPPQINTFLPLDKDIQEHTLLSSEFIFQGGEPVPATKSCSRCVLPSKIMLGGEHMCYQHAVAFYRREDPTKSVMSPPASSGASHVAPLPRSEFKFQGGEPLPARKTSLGLQGPGTRTRLPKAKGRGRGSRNLGPQGPGTQKSCSRCVLPSKFMLGGEHMCYQHAVAFYRREDPTKE